MSNAFLGLNNSPISCMQLAWVVIKIGSVESFWDDL